MLRFGKLLLVLTLLVMIWRRRNHMRGSTAGRVTLTLGIALVAIFWPVAGALCLVLWLLKR